MRRTTLFTLIALASIASAAGGQPATPLPVANTATSRSETVDLWLSHDQYYSRELVTAYYTAPPGSYLVVFRVSRGVVDVIYPRTPNGSQIVAATSHNVQTVKFGASESLHKTARLFASTADRPFDFTSVSEGGGWRRTRLIYPDAPTITEKAASFLRDITFRPATLLGVAQAEYWITEDVHFAPTLIPLNPRSGPNGRDCIYGATGGTCVMRSGAFGR